MWPGSFFLALVLTVRVQRLVKASWKERSSVRSPVRPEFLLELQ